LEGKFGHIIRQQFYGQHAHSHHGKFLFRSYIACKLQFQFLMESLFLSAQHSGQPPPELKRELLVHR
jgi:hypothetical protein